MRIELLYFEGCPSHQALLPALRALLKREAIDDEIEMRRVESLDAAAKERFLGSPTVRIDGEDYRHRRFTGDGPLPGLLEPGFAPGDPMPAGISWPELLEGLASVHPIQYAGIAAALPGLWVHDVTPLPNQDSALRFVHFVDKLYDHRVPLVVSGNVTLDESLDLWERGEKLAARCQDILEGARDRIAAVRGADAGVAESADEASGASDEDDE